MALAQGDMAPKAPRRNPAGGAAVIKTLAEEIAELERECRRLEEWRKRNRVYGRKETEGEGKPGLDWSRGREAK